MTASTASRSHELTVVEVITETPDAVSLVLMAAHKFSFASLIMVATFNVLQTDDDLQFFLRVMVVTMAWELFVCLKMKYLQGMYQVKGTFEHQNPLAMYAMLIGMVFLAAYYEITGHMPYRSGHAKGLLHQSQDAGTPPK